MSKNRVCIVTGASQGIGRAVAIALSQNDKFEIMVIIARSEEKLAKTRILCRFPDKVVAMPADLSLLDGIPCLIDSIAEKYGEIDLLVNLSGFADPRPLFETTIDSVKKTYDVNVFALLFMCKEVSRVMRRNRSGKIINIASTAGSTARPGWLSYSSSKAAVISISKTLSAELAEYGIRVYCVSPGRCATDLRRKLAPEEDPATIMQPEDVANVICNLASNTGNALDGQDIIVRYLPTIPK